MGLQAVLDFLCLQADISNTMMISLYRTAADGSLRYYSIHNRQPHLFSSYSFVASWGVQPSAGREKLYTFDTLEEMEDSLQQILERRLRGGYKVLYSFFGKNRIDMVSQERMNGIVDFPAASAPQAPNDIRHA